jgi:hypothetical protein
MNIVSVTVTGALMGMLSPVVANMSIQPFIAQKRAVNFSIVESKAVAYATLSEGAPALPPTNTFQFNGCDSNADKTTGAGSVTCTVKGKFGASVTRSFRLAQLQGGNTITPNKNYTPGVFCPLWDPWGIINYNDSHNVQCIPVPYGPWAYTYDGPILW